MYRFAINRPIATLMLMLSFIVFGLLSYGRMPVNLFPDVELPIITIETAYYGADPKTVESKVTDKIEEAVSTIEGIDKLHSTSFEGFSVVTVQFELSRNIIEAANDVRDKVGGVALDFGVEKPVVKKVSGTSGAVIALFASSKTLDEAALMKAAKDQLKPQIERIIGVGEVSMVGHREREIRIFANPFLLNKYRISAATLSEVLRAQNLRTGGGKLVSSTNETILKIRADANSVEALRDLKIAPGVRLEDVARVEDGLEDAQNFASLDGDAGVMLEVKKVAGANTLEIIQALKNIEPKLQALVGSEVKLDFLQDQSTEILQSINQVRDDLIFGAFLAVVIVFFFLRNATATFVSALAIPTSIIGTFAVIDWLGYDLNRLTLIGLTLAIGIFIDDAIVVIENISKKMEEGMEAFEAAYEGIRELAFTVLAISAMLLAVFVPVAFMDGIVGRFFNSFAMTVAAGVVISFVIALMLIPSAGARFLNPHQGWFYHKTEKYFTALDAGYRRLLIPLVQYKYWTLLGVASLLYLSTLLLPYVGNDFVPMEDKSQMQVIIKAPVGISLEAMRQEMEPFVETFAKDARIEKASLVIGYTAAKELHKAKFYIRLVPLGVRTQRQEEIVQEYREAFTETALHVMVEEVPMVDAGGSNAPVQIVLRGPNLEELGTQTKAVMKMLEGILGVVDVDSDFEAGTPEIEIKILQENAQRVGVDASQIASVIGASFSSLRPVSYFEAEGKQYDITLRMGDKSRVSIEDILALRVIGSSGQLVPLEGLVTLHEGFGATSINRFDKERSVLITANLFGIPLDAAAKEARANIEEHLKEGYSYRFTGDVEMMEDTNRAFAMAVLLAVVLIYLILAALYESLIQPLIIMVSMPLSFVGVMLGLYLSNMPFSLFVMIGMILLLGMVGKNAVLVVDFANQAIKEGKGVEEALLEAGEKRLRPILMTTLAMIFAMLPLALGQGAGHEGNAPMATAVIGGLISSTLLTLLVVPALYRILFPFDQWLRKWYEKGKL